MKKDNIDIDNIVAVVGIIVVAVSLLIVGLL